MAYIPREFIINPPTTVTINKQISTNNNNNTDRAGGEQTIKIVFKVKPNGGNKIYTVLNVITSTGRNLLCLE